MSHIINSLDPEHHKKLPIERALVAVGIPPGSAVFLAIAGKELALFANEISHNPNDIFGPEQIPAPVGIYHLEVEPYWHNESAWDEPPSWIIEFEVKECKKADSKELDTLLGLF